MLVIAQAVTTSSVSPASIVQIVLDALTLITVAVSAGLLYKQIRSNHEWNRRKTSQELLMQLVTGDFAKLREQLEVRFGAKLEDPDQTYSHVAPQLNAGDKETFNFNVECLLNFYETLAVGLKNNVLDEEICYDHFSWNLVRYWKWTQPYRTSMGLPPTIWIEAQHYANRWAVRHETDLAVLRREGKPAL